MKRVWLPGLLLLALLAGCGSPAVSEPVESPAAAFGIAESAVEIHISDPVTEPEPEETTVPSEEPAAEPSDKIVNQEPEDEPAETENSEIEEDARMPDIIYAEINGQRFSVTLDSTATADAFRAMLPAEWNMEELHGNEKYIYLEESFPADSQAVGYIETGDLMLYGDNCVVLFYDSFSTSYGYTRIGWIDDPDGLAEAVGGGNVTVCFGVE